MADPPSPSAPATNEPLPLVTPEAEPLPVTKAEIRSAVILLGIFVVTILLAVMFARPFSAGCDVQGQAADASKPCLQAFENPEDPINSVLYFVLILAFTFVILYIAKRGKKWLIRAIILGAVAVTIAYVVYPLAQLGGWFPARMATIPGVATFDVLSLVLAIAVAGGATFALYKHPEWYVIDTVGILVAAASAAIFGISFGLWPVLVLLLGLAIYDAIAVYRTKHMLALADSVIELRLPVLLVIPKHAWPRLQELRDFAEPERLYRRLVEDYLKGYNEADLVHADLSEYNVLVEGTDKGPETWTPRMIDVGQAVLKTHPMARQFLERDVGNLVKFFRRQKVDADPKDIIGRLVHERKQERERAPSRRAGYGTREDAE